MIIHGRSDFCHGLSKVKNSLSEMAGCDGWITIKILELLFATFCMIYKRVTDDEANKLFYFLQKFSREWPLLNNVTWEENGAIFTDITYGGYIIIIIGLIVGQCSGELQRCRKLENFFLIVGALLFIATGSLELAALDSVEERLVDNAAILGVFSLITGFLFIIDLLTAGKRRKKEKINTIKKWHLSKPTQTDNEKLDEIIVNGDVNGNVRNGAIKFENGEAGIDRRPKNEIKILPSSPTINDYVLTSEKHHNEYAGPMEYFAEPPIIDGEDLKTHEGRIKSTESFLRSEKGLYPKIRKVSEQDRSSNHYFIPSGYVLVPASHIQSKNVAKSDSGIGESYTPPNYSKITPNMKVKNKKNSGNYLVIPVEETYAGGDETRKLQSPTITTTVKAPHDAYYRYAQEKSYRSPCENGFNGNSSDDDSYDDPRSESCVKKIRGKYFEDEKGQRFVLQSEESSDEQKGSYRNEERSRSSSRFSRRSEEWHSKGEINEGYADDKDNVSYSGRSTPYHSSIVATSEKPKILRFDRGRSSKKENGLYFPKDVQYDSLDGRKIAEDLKNLKEITRSDMSLTRNSEAENYVLKGRPRADGERKEKPRRPVRDVKKSDREPRDSEGEKNRGISEREEQYFGLKDLKQSHRERRFEDSAKTKKTDDLLKPGAGAHGKGTNEINERLKEKHLDAERKAAKQAQEYRDLIDERFYFLEEEEKLKNKKGTHSDSETPSNSKRELHKTDSFPHSERTSKKEKSDSDETNYTQSTDEEIRLRVETPGNTSYKSEARFWLDNKEDDENKSTTPLSPINPGYVLHTAQNWPESPSPQDRFQFTAKEAQHLTLGTMTRPSSSLGEKTSLSNSRVLDSEESSKAAKHPLTRQKGLLVRKDDVLKEILTEMKRPNVIAGSTNTWKKWLQPKPKLIQTKSTPN